MQGSHGIIQGYNAQTLVDDKHQVIVHGEAFGDAQDHSLITPVLDGAKENIKEIGRSEDDFEEKTLAADSNYHDPDNFKKEWYICCGQITDCEQKGPRIRGGQDSSVEVMKSLESDYPKPQAGAFSPIHGFATAIS